MKKYFFILSMLAMAFAHAQQRVVLYEHFSNANCSNCGIYTPQLTTFVEGKNAEAVMLGYQVNTPYSDGIYNENKTDVDARKNLYGISGTPYTIMDGNYFKNSTAPFLNQAAAKHTARLAVQSTFSIDLSGLTRVADRVQGTVSITSLSDNSTDNLKAYIVFAERRVLKSSYAVPPGNNSETEYPYVMRKFAPDALGTTIFKKDMNEVTSIAIDQMVPNVKAWDELRVIAFVQNTSTNEIYQAAISTPSVVSSVAQIEELKLEIFPNPVHDMVTVSTNTSQPLKLTITNAIGEKISESNFAETISINTQNFSSGIYFFTLKDEQGKTINTKRIIKN